MARKLYLRGEDVTRWVDAWPSQVSAAADSAVPTASFQLIAVAADDSGDLLVDVLPDGPLPQDDVWFVDDAGRPLPLDPLVEFFSGRVKTVTDSDTDDGQLQWAISAAGYHEELNQPVDWITFDTADLIYGGRTYHMDRDVDRLRYLLALYLPTWQHGDDFIPAAAFATYDGPTSYRQVPLVDILRDIATYTGLPSDPVYPAPARAWRIGSTAAGGLGKYLQYYSRAAGVTLSSVGVCTEEASPPDNNEVLGWNPERPMDTSGLFNAVAIRGPGGDVTAVQWDRDSLVNVSAGGNTLTKDSGVDGTYDAGAFSEQSITSEGGYCEVRPVPPEGTETTLVWSATGRINVAVSGAALTKNGGTDGVFNAGAFGDSSQGISDLGGYVQTRLPLASRVLAFGLSHSDSGATADTIGLGIRTDGSGHFTVYAGLFPLSPPLNVADGDSVRVRIGATGTGQPIPATVEQQLAGTPDWTPVWATTFSAGALTFPLYADSSLATIGDEWDSGARTSTAIGAPGGYCLATLHANKYSAFGWGRGLDTLYHDLRDIRWGIYTEPGDQCVVTNQGGFIARFPYTDDMKVRLTPTRVNAADALEVATQPGALTEAWDSGARTSTTVPAAGAYCQAVLKTGKWSAFGWRAAAGALTHTLADLGWGVYTDGTNAVITHAGSVQASWVYTDNLTVRLTAAHVSGNDTLIVEKKESGAGTWDLVYTWTLGAATFPFPLAMIGVLGSSSGAAVAGRIKPAGGTEADVAWASAGSSGVAISGNSISKALTWTVQTTWILTFDSFVYPLAMVGVLGSSSDTAIAGRIQPAGGSEADVVWDAGTAVNVSISGNSISKSTSPAPSLADGLVLITPPQVVEAAWGFSPADSDADWTSIAVGLQTLADGTLNIIEAGTVLADFSYERGDHFRLDLRPDAAGVMQAEAIRIYGDLSGAVSLYTWTPSGLSYPLFVDTSLATLDSHLADVTIRRHSYNRFQRDDSVGAPWNFGAIWADQVLEDESLDTVAKRQAFADRLFDAHAYPRIGYSIETDGRRPDGTRWQFDPGMLVPFRDPGRTWDPPVYLPLGQVTTDWSTARSEGWPTQHLEAGDRFPELGDSPPYLLRTPGLDTPVPAIPTGLVRREWGPDGAGTAFVRLGWDRTTHTERWILLSVTRLDTGRGGDRWVPFGPILRVDAGRIDTILNHLVPSRYRVEIAAEDSRGRPSPFGNGISFTVPALVPDPVATLTLVRAERRANGLGAATLAWTLFTDGPPEGVVGWDLVATPTTPDDPSFAPLVDDLPEQIIVPIRNLTARQGVVDNLTIGQLYVIRAYTVSVWGERSATAPARSVRVIALAPHPPPPDRDPVTGKPGGWSQNVGAGTWAVSTADLYNGPTFALACDSGQDVGLVTDPGVAAVDGQTLVLKLAWWIDVADGVLATARLRAYDGPDPVTATELDTLDAVAGAGSLTTIQRAEVAWPVPPATVLVTLELRGDSATGPVTLFWALEEWDTQKTDVNIGVISSAYKIALETDDSHRQVFKDLVTGEDAMEIYVASNGDVVFVALPQPSFPRNNHIRWQDPDGNAITFTATGILVDSVGPIRFNRMLALTPVIVPGSATLSDVSSVAHYTGSGGDTVTLPLSSAAGDGLLIIRNRGSGGITLARQGSDTIEGATSVSLAAGSSLPLVAISGGWIALWGGVGSGTGVVPTFAAFVKWENT